MRCVVLSVLRGKLYKAFCSAATHAAQDLLFNYWISLPLRSCSRYFNSLLYFFYPLFLSHIIDILSSQPETLTCILLLYFLSVFVFETPPLLLVSPLHIYSLSPITPPFMHLSSFLLDRLLSEIAAGSSVAQLGINKHLDISLLILSLVALFFSLPFFFLTQGQDKCFFPFLCSQWPWLSERNTKRTAYK